MAYDERFADRIRSILADEPDLTERKMFGGLAFMIAGNMACGPVEGILMVRVGPDAYEDALTEPGARPLEFTGRPMRGFVEIDIADLDDDERLAEWVTRGLDFARSLPPK